MTGTARNRTRNTLVLAVGLSMLLFAAKSAIAQDAPPAPTSDAAELAKKLANPVASLIQVPFQLNFDGRIGPDREGERITLNVQPVVPISLNADWNIISRTILPIVWQSDIAPGLGNQFGLGDTVQSLFFVPTKPSSFIWGVGPAFLLPTGTDTYLSGGKWGAGPTAVVLKQMGGWTIGGLGNHIWSIAGSSTRQDISSTFLNPFVSHASKTAFTVALAADFTHDWTNDKSTMPMTLSASQLVKIGSQLVTFGGGIRYYVLANEASPHGFAGRLSMTLLFPK